MVKNSEIGFFQYKLGRKLVLRVVLFSSLVTLILTAIQFGFEFRQLTRKLDQVPQFIETTMSPAIAESIWKDDRAQLHKLLQGINQLEFVDANKLHLADGERLEYVANESINSRSYPINILREGEKLGAIELVVSIDAIFSHMLGQLYIILIKNGFKTAFVVFFMFMLFRSLVGQHLLRMINFMKQQKEGADQPVLNLDRTQNEQEDELDELADAFNQLIQRIEEENRARLHEINQRQEAESQIVHLERVGTMGQLATGLAHELNQPLAGIMGYSDIALRLSKQGNADPKLLECLTKIGDEAERSAKIIQRTRSFIRREPAKEDIINFTDVIQESMDIMSHRALQAGVEVEFNQTETAWIQMSRTQMQQVLVNLINNAVEVLENQADARIELTLYKEDGHICLSVLDNGPGFDTEIQAHLFEPFRTTKESGLGLGLVICRNLIEAAKGKLTAGNHSLKGAEFIIRLPVVEEKEVE